MPVSISANAVANSINYESLYPKTVPADRVAFILGISVMKAHPGNPGFANNTFDKLRVLEASVKASNDGNPKAPLASVVYEVICDNTMLNPMDVMHGGCIATIFDNSTTYAIAVLDKYWKDFDPTKESLEDYSKKLMPALEPDLGVTRQLQVTYYKAIFPGQVLHLNVDLENISRTFSTFKAALYDDKGRVCASCTHDKVKLSRRQKL